MKVGCCVKLNLSKWDVKHTYSTVHCKQWMSVWGLYMVITDSRTHQLQVLWALYYWKRLKLLLSVLVMSSQTCNRTGDLKSGREFWTVGEGTCSQVPLQIEVHGNSLSTWQTLPGSPRKLWERQKLKVSGEENKIEVCESGGNSLKSHLW